MIETQPARQGRRFWFLSPGMEFASEGPQSGKPQFHPGCWICLFLVENPLLWESPFWQTSLTCSFMWAAAFNHFQSPLQDSSMDAHFQVCIYMYICIYIYIYMYNRSNFLLQVGYCSLCQHMSTSGPLLERAKSAGCFGEWRWNDVPRPMIALSQGESNMTKCVAPLVSHFLAIANE